MKIKSTATSDQDVLRVDYFPHRIRLAGRGCPDVAVEPHDVAEVRQIAEVEVIEPEVVSEAIPAAQ